MCGIAGYFGETTRETLQKMNSLIAHRGPDDEGFYFGSDVGLAQRRLSIIDLSPTGHQPMSNEDGTVWITFNGEIYNFQDLRKELEGKHVFRGRSDTEVIVHLYEEVGEKVFEKIHGMFALALYDTKKDELILARDRMGKKPLYYMLQDGLAVFASELKSIMVHPAFNKQLDYSSINKYFLYEYIPTPNTPFQNVKKLEPGHYIRITRSGVTKKQYWDMTFSENKIPFQNALSLLDNALEKATKDRLMSEVPLGIFLSGGIDSSTIAYYAQKNSAQKIKTFSIGFNEKTFDESSYAREVAVHLGTEHHEQILTGKDCLELVPQIGDLLDEPLADASLIPTFLLSRFTREHVTVALGGDGADELLCGYDTFLAHKFARPYSLLPKFLQKNINRLAEKLPTSFSNISFDFKVKKFTQGFHDDALRRNQQWLGAFDRNSRSTLFSVDAMKKMATEREFDELDTIESKAPVGSVYNKLIYAYCKTYLLDDILMKVDRASMYNSLEVRAPFLDINVVELLNKLPVSYKLHGSSRKYILKQLMKNRLPAVVTSRKKKGFGIPLADWLATDLKGLSQDLLSSHTLASQGIFEPKTVELLMQNHYNHKVDNRKKLWTLLVFQLWWNRWVKS